MARLTKAQLGEISGELQILDLQKGNLPRFASSGCTRSESAFKILAQHKGMKVRRAGWPDFLVKTVDGRTVGVEVKEGIDTIRPSQVAMFEALEAAGIAIYVWRSSKPGSLVPWRKDLEGS